MIALYLSSPEGHVGKTMLCASLGRWLIREGKKVGFFQPLSVVSGGETKSTNVMKRALCIQKSIDIICPVSTTKEELKETLSTNRDSFNSRIQEAFQLISQEKDIVLIEGPGGMQKGSIGEELLKDTLSLTDARLLVVIQYSDSSTADFLEGMADELKDKIIGVIINSIPANRMERHDKIREELDVTVFGFVPQERALMGIGIKELGERIDADIEDSVNWPDELIENVMVGAMTLDHGPYYFNRKSNKAVVIRGERPDMQLAALETSTRCLVLTGGIGPIDAVSRQATRKGVPIMTVQDDTSSVLSRIEDAIQAAGLDHEKKLKRLDDMISENLDLSALYKAIGL
ncbi:AAA family ATPase [Chloroflexota bacterium]